MINLSVIINFNKFFFIVTLGFEYLKLSFDVLGNIERKQFWAVHEQVTCGSAGEKGYFTKREHILQQALNRKYVKAISEN